MRDSVIASRYALTASIATGGMGQVWKGRDIRLERDIAVKVIRPDLLGVEGARADVIARFRREAQVMARVRHSGVPAIFDADFDPEADQLYLVMEFIDGLSLDDAIAEAAPLPWAQVAAIGAQIAAVLHQAHHTPVIHRDLKPGNVLIGSNGQVKVVDFGIAAVMETDQTRLTSTGDRVGTDHYMSPEQINGETVGHYTDLYALGCLLFEMATGRRVFDTHTQYAVLHAHATQRPPSLQKFRSQTPEVLSDLVETLLAKDPKDRPDSAGEVYRLLHQLLRSLLDVQSTDPLGDAGDPTWPFRFPLASFGVVEEYRLAGDDDVGCVKTQLREAEEIYDRKDLSGALTRFRALGKQLRVADPVAALHCRSRAAECLAEMGHTRAAASGLSKVADEQRQLLGPNNVKVLRTRLKLAHLNRSLAPGEYDLAELRSLVEDLVAEFGPTHPETVEAQLLLRQWQGTSTATGE